MVIEGSVNVGASHRKQKLDKEMLAIMRQRAAARSENPDRVTLAPWPNHDVRRTCRSTLSRLGIPQDVAEAVLAHKRPGILGVYDQWHRYPEKREALEKWSHFLADLMYPRPVEAGAETARGA